MRSKVLVLLAAYNGKKWILEQINSILAQRGVDISILISVDKSSDGTEEFVEELANNNEKITFLPMGSVYGGAAKNFFRLIIEADVTGFDYISFSDQDDIWLDDKLMTAVEHLSRNDFYSSNVTAFWEDGRNSNIIKSQPLVEFDYLFEAAGPGCTYVMSKHRFNQLRNFIINNKTSVLDFCLHDWFIYAYARNHNLKWYIDSKPGMLYRQHDSNQVGANDSLKAMVKRFNLIKNKWYRLEIAKLINIFSLDNSFIHKALQKGYLGNLYLLINVRKLRRRLRDRIMLGVALLINAF